MRSKPTFALAARHVVDIVSCCSKGEQVSDPRPRQNNALTRTNPRPSSTYGRPTKPKPPSSSNNGCLALGAVGVLIFVIAKCASSDGGTSSTPSPTSNAQQAIETAVQAQQPLPVQPLSRLAVARGLANVKLAGVEGRAGEMIYSQNCYDALGHAFSWSKLDSCGAFDAEVSSLQGDDVSGAEGSDVSWFQSEAAAGRFLKAAVAAGESADEADQRWSAIQKRADAGRPAIDTAQPLGTNATTDENVPQPVTNTDVYENVDANSE